ncbi:hypothetical protein M9H77_17888 [Catharanthus roseus]|uniref:Uncharacterized protein n=1 Tax=Catharanthus roseus TaxID=4058 RepID=A0ACC0B5W0_CATRO|nr:hypothetical protein M9H77_17888 [Catharanthus roseus]
MGQHNVDRHQIPHPSQPLLGRGRHVPAFVEQEVQEGVQHLLPSQDPLGLERALGDGDATTEQGTSPVYHAMKECISKYPDGDHAPPNDCLHFFMTVAICEGDKGGSRIATEAISSTSCNMEV